MKNRIKLLLIIFSFSTAIQAQVLHNLVNSEELYVQGVPWFPTKTHATSATVGVRLKYNFDTQNFDYMGGDWRSFNNLLFHGADLHFVTAETWNHPESFPNSMTTQQLIQNHAKMTLIGHSGFVGIGITLPEEKLHIDGGRIKISSNAPVIDFFEKDLNNRFFIAINNGHFYISHNTTDHGDFVVNKYGNIGMGTWVSDEQSYKLSVAGKIRAHEIKVYTGWADYVFADNYELLTLEETEAYINENKHLPGIPSAEEVEENEGVNLGEMQKLQMAKIEELTLYMIAMKKELEKLKEENKQLKAAIIK